MDAGYAVWEVEGGESANLNLHYIMCNLIPKRRHPVKGHVLIFEVKTF